mmetsp:Transcript_1470/g.3255  ORF Transcript_1470/g.3255 Transcript_1470/m.3255 type:complete len:272 (-) Transcript_1470:469-1284(-)|eukprot:CAMPEP_0168167510 /NCGR_PEP_ID=MMETSP0139_2-20121125/2583_1 /TAXON_ID=44445 /ORGANISM="Pseudo-nitzschia australis, Strain 10249 10 AB" /LENGTH=271 /DNA_ID=CAMNT_0008084747 /DNA_START=177 /DNA_END=992 /DNA_ORIENTATION=+
MGSEEQEWIEQPGGWEGDKIETATGTVSVDNDDDEEEPSGGFDLFADDHPEYSFPFEVPLKEEGKSIRLQLEGFKLDTDEAAQSTGVTLWQAAPRLAEYITKEREELVEGKSVLELGAGLGLCGMVAHHLGAESVTITDADTITLRQMRRNLETNCPNSNAHSNSIDVRQLIWNNIDQMKDCGKFDTILGADVIYAISSLKPLFDTVAYFLGKENEGIESQPRKQQRSFVLSRYCKWGHISDETVLEAAEARNLVWTHPSEGIYVFRLQEE